MVGLGGDGSVSGVADGVGVGALPTSSPSALVLSSLGLAESDNGGDRAALSSEVGLPDDGALPGGLLVATTGTALGLPPSDGRQQWFPPVAVVWPLVVGVGLRGKPVGVALGHSAGGPAIGRVGVDDSHSFAFVTGGDRCADVPLQFIPPCVTSSSTSVLLTEDDCDVDASCPRIPVVETRSVVGCASAGVVHSSPRQGSPVTVRARVRADLEAWCRDFSVDEGGEWMEGRVGGRSGLGALFGMFAAAPQRPELPLVFTPSRFEVLRSVGDPKAEKGTLLTVAEQEHFQAAVRVADAVLADVGSPSPSVPCSPRGVSWGRGGDGVRVELRGAVGLSVLPVTSWFCFF
ncbi:hypothetical protein Dimus_001093 [Dionaea muscipula]